MQYQDHISCDLSHLERKVFKHLHHIFVMHNTCYSQQPKFSINIGPRRTMLNCYLQ